jgi:SAM-dependent methyltransferase
LIPASIHTLEIGPYARPLLNGPNVKYVDVYSTKELKKLAPAVGMDPNEVPHINWVAKPSDLSSVDEHFGAVLSSHVIEHQPDFIHHLNQISEILKHGGRYFVLIPDHRYCFDHFMTPSTITDVVAAHLHKRTGHTAESLLESRLLMTHNDPIEHWNGNHGDPLVNPHFPGSDRIDRIKIAIDSFYENNEYIKNEHAWYFTPDSFMSIVNDLIALNLINIEVERIYPTMKNSGEFWVILRTKTAEAT